MPVIKFVSADGASSQEIQAAQGVSVMQAAMENGIEGIVAECGGSSSCATCHVYVDEGWRASLQEPLDTEKDMLDCVAEPTAGSRLSCQIVVTEELNGLVVQVPKSQY